MQALSIVGLNLQHFDMYTSRQNSMGTSQLVEWNSGVHFSKSRQYCSFFFLVLCRLGIVNGKLLIPVISAQIGKPWSGFSQVVNNIFSMYCHSGRVAKYFRVGFEQELTSEHDMLVSFWQNIDRQINLWSARSYFKSIVTVLFQF